MRCPFCGFEDTQVKDTRPSDDNSMIKRRRLCSACGSRFTTHERVQLCELTIIKKNEARVPFDREKLARSIYVATRKRPIEPAKLERVINGIVRRLETLGESEISSQMIGAYAMESLEHLDPVSYIRFASVYRDFKEVKDFKDFLTNETNCTDPASSE